MLYDIIKIGLLVGVILCGLFMTIKPEHYTKKEDSRAKLRWRITGIIICIIGIIAVILNLKTINY